MGSMWWGVSKGSISSLSPFCAGFHRMPAFWCTWKSADTSRDYFGPSLLLFLFAALDGPHWKKGKDWQLFDCIWCFRSYTELSSTCLLVQSPQLFLLLTSFVTSFRGVCNRNAVWIFCDCNSGNLEGQWTLRSSLGQDLNWCVVGALETISRSKTVTQVSSCVWSEVSFLHSWSSL